MQHLTTGFLLFISVLGASQGIDIHDPEYLANYENWQLELRESRNGYLKLVVLCRLNEGTNSFGTDAESDCRIDVPGIASKIGTYLVHNGTLTFNPTNDVEIQDGLKAITAPTPIQLDDHGDSPTLIMGRLSWKVITRGGNYYIRAYDAQNPAVDTFPGFKHFPLNQELVFDAEFEYFSEPKESTINSRIGVEQTWPFIGQVKFNYNNRSYTLDVGAGGFTMVRDLTSGDITYGGGRYTYIAVPDTDGPVRLDFNRLYNPPCAFSKYTTCLLPPAQNTLDFKVNAGETLERAK